MRAHLLVRTLILTGIASLSMVGCSQRAAGDTACLAGNNECINTVIEINSSNTEVIAWTNTLTCAALAGANSVRVGENLTVNVTTTGSRGSISVKDGTGLQVVGSASVNATFFKSYPASNAGSVVQENLMVLDSTGQSAYCSYQVLVQPAVITPPATTLACAISVSPFAPVAGQVTIFTLTALNTTSPAYFSQFYGSSDWGLADANIQYVSSTQSRVVLAYSVVGNKTASVRVSAGGQNAVCTLPVTVVGASNPVPQPPTALSCNVSMAPMGSAGSASAPALQGGLARVTATGVGGTAPYTLESVSSSFTTMDSFSGIPAGSPMARVVRFRQPGQPQVTVAIRDSAGQTVSCFSTFAVQPNSVFATSIMAGANSTPRVQAMNGSVGYLLEDFMAYASSFTGGVAVGTGDFDLDSQPDYVTIEATGGMDNIKIFKGDSYPWSSDKGTPAQLWNGYGGLPADATERRLAIGDFDADGFADIAVANGCMNNTGIAPRIRILSGSTKSLIREIAVNFQIGAMAAGDLNADGYSDIAIASCNGASVISYSGLDIKTAMSSSVPYLTNLSLPAIASGDRPALALGDFNRDSYLDFLVVYNENNTAWVRAFSSLNGSVLTSFRTLTDGWTKFRAGTADLDGDATADILLAASSSGSKYAQIDLLNGAASVQMQSAQKWRTLQPFYGWTGSIGISGGGL
jgi:hypothetical protein